MTQHKTVSPRDPWGPGATTPKLPCQLAEQPPCPGLPCPMEPASNKDLQPPSSAQSWGQQQGSCSLGTPRRCPVCPAAHPHCHALGSDQVLRAGVWLEKPLPAGAEAPQAWSWVWAGSLHHSKGTDPQETRQDEEPAVGPALSELPHSSPERQHQQQGRCCFPWEQELGWSESEGQLHLRYSSLIE